MNQNWIQGDISGSIDKNSSTATPARHVPIGKKFTRKQKPKRTPWEAVQQMWIGKQVNDVSGKI